MLLYKSECKYEFYNNNKNRKLNERRVNTCSGNVVRGSWRPSGVEVGEEGRGLGARGTWNRYCFGVWIQVTNMLFEFLAGI